ncbi:MAG: hypothetical protein ACREH6_04530 [Geminicoccaceae bacterium]
MNQKVYAVCAGIDDAERRRDRGAFFRSIPPSGVDGQTRRRSRLLCVSHLLNHRPIIAAS